MTGDKFTIFDRFLRPILERLVDREAMERLYHRVDWEQEADRWRRPSLTYPAYYAGQNFHGITNGYLSPGAAITYDPITQYVLPPNETVVRQGLLNAIQGHPRRILDLGCGTGSTTLMLKRAFPNAAVIGLDLSPYMLVMAEIKAQDAGLAVQWRHGLAEATGLPDASVDLVTASLLFHETPPDAAAAILREAFRLLTAGGQVIVLDGNQSTLRQVDWLTQVFEEPYIKSYAASSVDAWLADAGFGYVQTQDHWWFHQVSSGIKPLASGAAPGVQSQREPISTFDGSGTEGIPTPAFGSVSW